MSEIDHHRQYLKGVLAELERQKRECGLNEDGTLWATACPAPLRPYVEYHNEQIELILAGQNTLF